MVAQPGDRLGYLYDFGDHWIHHLELDKVITRPRVGVIYPRCSAGKRACPPEDCGGPWGYADTLKVLRSRKGWRYQQARELCSTKFDPESSRARGKTIGGATVTDDHMLSHALHLRGQGLSLREIVARLVIAQGKKKDTTPPRPLSCGCCATTTRPTLAPNTH